MLLPKSLSDIAAEDIREFARTFSEGLRVEYKSALTDDVRSKVPKIVSSFANSYGGVLIFGINTQLGVPAEPIDGYDTPEREELAVTVQDLCIGNVHPSLFPRTRQISGDVAGKSFLVVEVDESREAPHAIENSRKVYIRTGDSQRPYDIADIQTIDRLLTRRKGVSARKDELTAEAETLARRYVDLEHIPLLTIVVTPLYPAAPLTERENAYACLARVDGFRDKVFRHPTGACVRDVSSTSFVLWKLSIYGHLFAMELLRRASGSEFGGGADLTNEAEVYPFSWIVGTLRKVFLVAGGFFDNLRFVGELQVEITLRNVANKSFAGGKDFLPIKLSSIAPTVPANTVVTASQLQTRECLSDVFYQLLWPFLPSEDISTRAGANSFVGQIVQTLSLRQM